MSKNWVYSWQQSFSKTHKQFSHLENSAKITGKISIGPVARKTNTMQHGKLRTDCCPWFNDQFFELDYTYISSIVIARLCSLHCVQQQHEVRMWVTVQGDLSLKPTKTQNPNESEDPERARGDLLRDLPESLQEFTENLVEERVPAHRDAPVSSSRESASETLRKVVLGKHNIETHFPKDPNCDIRKRTKITRAPCRKRTGAAIPREEKFDDLITEDHKVLSEGCESRSIHRYAVVVQDLATQWIQSYPCKTSTSQGTEKSLQNFLEPTRNQKVIYTDNSPEFGKTCEDLSRLHQFGNKVLPGRHFGRRHWGVGKDGRTRNLL